MIESATVCLMVAMVIFLSWYCQRLRSRCEEKDATINAMDEAYTSVAKALTCKNAELKTTQYNLDTTQKLCEEKSAVCRELRQSIESMAIRISGLESDLGVKISQCNHCKHTRKNLVAYRDELQQTIQDIRAEKQKWENHSNGLTKDLARLLKEKQDRELTIGMKQDRIDELERLIKFREGEITSLIDAKRAFCDYMINQIGQYRLPPGDQDSEYFANECAEEGVEIK